MEVDAQIRLFLAADDEVKALRLVIYVRPLKLLINVILIVIKEKLHCVQGGKVYDDP